MTLSGWIMTVLILLIAAWFWYAYTTRKVDSGLVVRMWRARREGRDRLRSVLKNQQSVTPVAQKRTERPTPARPFLRPMPLFAETGTIGDVDGPDVSTADLRAKRLPSAETLAFLSEGRPVNRDQPAHALAGDDTGGVAEVHLQATVADPAFDPQESVTNVLPQAPPDSYVESDGDMHHDQPAVGLVDLDAFHGDAGREKE